MKTGLLTLKALVPIVVASATIAVAPAQQSNASLPIVVAAAVPLYPIGPLIADIEGTVRVRVTTNGRRVAEATVVDGPPALARAARENVLTWQFSAAQAPTTFTVSYRYKLVSEWKQIETDTPNCRVVIRFPTDVEVYALRWPRDPGVVTTK